MSELNSQQGGGRDLNTLPALLFRRMKDEWSYSSFILHTSSFCLDSLLLFPNAMQVLIRAQQQLAVADRRGGVRPAGVVFEHVVRQQLVLGAGRHHVGPL